MENFYIIGDLTTLTAPGSVVLLVGIIAVLFLPRRFVVVAFIAVACAMTIGQQIVVASLHFTIFRLMIAVALVRIILRKEIWLERLTTMDKALIVWVALGWIFPALRLGTTAAIINRFGAVYNTLGLFFIFRFTIRSYQDLRLVAVVLAIMMPMLLFMMSVEKLTGRNLYSIFGGVPQFTLVRVGRLRAQGPFRHPVLAGTFGATSIPMIAQLWYQKKSSGRFLSFIGVMSASLIVVLSASSGPIMSCFTAILSILIWDLRKNLKNLWYLFLMTLIIIAAIMKAPIWFLIGRLSDIFGGTGDHRSMLIDQAIKHFGEWWLAGTSYTAHWMPYSLGVNPEMVDITNQFIGEGVNGGVFTLSAFVFLVVIAFRTLSAAVRVRSHDRQETRIAWGLWGSLLSHVVTFFAVSYFDQMAMFWLLLLACISFVRSKEALLSQPNEITLNGVAHISLDEFL